jgi:biopolymer transport protein ExbD
MKVISPLVRRRGRLEIIPLIDIMFFLLAAFMLVSIDKIRVRSLPVSLPTNVPAAQLEKKEDFTSISVDADGKIQLDQDIITSKDALLAKLQALYAQNKEQKFLISADREARHGDVVGVLGALRSAGFQKVGFSLSTTPGLSGTPGSPAPPSAPAPSVAPAAPTAPAPSAVPAASAAPETSAAPTLAPPPDSTHP